MDSSEVLSPSGEAPRGAGGSDSGVEVGGPPGPCFGIDGYASGFESLVGGATSCDSSLLSYCGDLESLHLEEAARGGKHSPSDHSSLSPCLPSPGAMSQSLTTSLSAPKLMNGSLRLSSKRSENKSSSTKALNTRRSEPRSLSQNRAQPTLDDGRWPSVNSRPTSKRSAGPPSNTERRSQARHELATRNASQNTLDKYATLPRKARHVKVTTPPADSGPKSILSMLSTSREPSLNRAASLRRQRTMANSTGSCGYRSDAEDVSGSSVRSKSLTRTLPAYPRRRRANVRDNSAQTQRTDPRSPEDMEAELLVLTAEHDKLSREVDVSIKSLLKEKEARQKLLNDVESANKKMLHMLARDGAETTPQADLLSEIETRLTATSEVAAKNHKELVKAQRAHCKMTEELHKAKEAASSSQQQFLDLQEESNELIDFLTAEKTTLAESLKEAEDKIVILIAQMESKDKDIERQQDECRHLVKLSEQRRQEIVALQAKLDSTERLLVLQGGTTTAASMALDELCSRLESILPRIRDADKGVEVFHNEAYNSTPEVSPRPMNTKSAEGDDSLEGVQCPELDARPLVGSESLQDLTQAIITCQAGEPEKNAEQKASLTDQASQLDKLVSKVVLAFQSVIKQQELSAMEATKLKEKLESETGALMEANLQLEQKQHRIQHLEAAQRLAQKTSSDEISALKTLLSEKELSVKPVEGNNHLLSNWKVAAEEMNRQYLAIDKALDVLHKEQEFVNKNPSLVQLQADLEETNFRCVTLPALVPEELILNGINMQDLNPKIAPSVRVSETLNGTA